MSFRTETNEDACLPFCPLDYTTGAGRVGVARRRRNAGGSLSSTAGRAKLEALTCGHIGAAWFRSPPPDLAGRELTVEKISQERGFRIHLMCVG